MIDARSMNLFRSNNGLKTVLIMGGLVVLFASTTTTRAEDLPKADTILDRYIEVTGGKAKYEALKNVVFQANLEAAPGMSLKLKSYQAPPDKMYVAVEIPGMGQSEQGYSNGVAWEKTAGMPPRIRSGDEATEFKNDAEFNRELRWRDAYKEVKTLGVEDVDGKPAYKVELIPKEGETAQNLYDKESGLLLRSLSKKKGPMGEATVEINFSDYKEAGGVKFAHKMVVKSGPQAVTMVFEKYEVNVDIPADRFDLPADVKALAEKEKSAKPEEKKPEVKKP